MNKATNNADQTTALEKHDSRAPKKHISKNKDRDIPYKHP